MTRLRSNFFFILANTKLIFQICFNDVVTISCIDPELKMRVLTTREYGGTTNTSLGSNSIDITCIKYVHRHNTDYPWVEYSAIKDDYSKWFDVYNFHNFYCEPSKFVLFWTFSNLKSDLFKYYIIRRSFYWQLFFINIKFNIEFSKRKTWKIFSIIQKKSNINPTRNTNNFHYLVIVGT